MIKEIPIIGPYQALRLLEKSFLFYKLTSRLNAQLDWFEIDCDYPQGLEHGYPIIKPLTSA